MVSETNVNVRLPTPIKDKFYKLARLKKRTMSDVLRRLIEKAIKESDGKAVN